MDLTREELYRSTRSDDYRVVGFDHVCGALAYGDLLGDVLFLLDVHIAVVDVGVDLDGLAVRTVKEVFLLEHGEILAYGDLRYVQYGRQIGYAHRATRIKLLNDQIMPFVDSHCFALLVMIVKIIKITRYGNSRRHNHNIFIIKYRSAGHKFAVAG